MPPPRRAAMPRIGDRSRPRCVAASRSSAEGFFLVQVEEVDMKAVSVLVGIALTASPVFAQQPAPIRASMEKAVATAADPAAQSRSVEGSGGRSKLFWSGLVVGLAGVTTSALGLTVFRTEDTSTGN